MQDEFFTPLQSQEQDDFFTPIEQPRISSPRVSSSTDEFETSGPWWNPITQKKGKKVQSRRDIDVVESKDDWIANQASKLPGPLQKPAGMIGSLIGQGVELASDPLNILGANAAKRLFRSEPKIPKPKELPPAKLYGGPSGGSGQVMIGDDLLDNTTSKELVGNPPKITYKQNANVIDLPKKDYSIDSMPDRRVQNLSIEQRKALAAKERSDDIKNADRWMDLSRKGDDLPLNEPQALGAVEAPPGNSIPPIAEIVQEQPNIARNLSTLDDTTVPDGPKIDPVRTDSISNEPFDPDTLFPSKADVLDSDFRRAMLKKEAGEVRSVTPTERTLHFGDNTTTFPERLRGEKGSVKLEPLNDIGESLSKSRFGEAYKRGVEEEGGGLVGHVTTVGNTMKSAMSTGDLSAPFRQGAALVHKKEFRKNLPEMVKMFNDDKVFTEAMDKIKSSPTFKFAQDVGLDLTGLTSGREERFLNTVMEEVPGYGKVVKASDRAYTGFLNKLRFDTFNSLLKDAHKAGYAPGTNKEFAREIAQFVNEATGRGGLGKKGEKAADLLNALFYSPKLFSSRVRMINRVVNPYMYYKQSEFIRKEALKSALSLASMNLTINGLALAAGGKVTYDLTNSDFMKNKFGNTRVDFGAGFLQPLVFAARLMTGKYTSSTTGRTSKLDSPGYGRTTSGDVVKRFVLSKEAPLLGLVGELWSGKDWSGEEKSRLTTTAERFIPMIAQDLYDIAKEDPWMAPLIMPGIFGASVQTYKNPRQPLRMPNMEMRMPSP